jgi:hypothetical protein
MHLRNVVIDGLVKIKTEKINTDMKCMPIRSDVYNKFRLLAH